MLALLLTWLGRFPEARVELGAYTALFPEDAQVRTIHACLLALEGDLTAANAVLDGLQGPDSADVGVLRAFVNICFEVRNPANIDPHTGAPNVKRLLGRLLPEFVRLGSAPAGVGSAPEDLYRSNQRLGQGLHVPLFVRKRLVPAAGACVAAAFSGKSVPAKAIDDLSEAAVALPEGTLLCARAQMLFRARRFREAEQAALEAADTPAFLPTTRRLALDLALESETALADQHNATSAASLAGLASSPLGLAPLYATSALAARDSVNPVLPTWRRAAENLRKLLALGPLYPAERPGALRVALNAQEIGLARAILADWERQSPADPGALSWRAQTELRANAYGPALEAAEKVLQQKRDDALMLRVKQGAAEKLIRQAQALERSKRAP